MKHATVTRAYLRTYFRRWSLVLPMVLVTSVTLAACGGGSDTQAANPATRESSSRPTVNELAAELRAKGVPCGATIEPSEGRDIGVREEGQCRIQGERFGIYTFNTNSARDTATTVGSEFGAIYVVGDRWAVEVPDDTWAGRVAAALDGEVR